MRRHRGRIKSNFQILWWGVGDENCQVVMVVNDTRIMKNWGAVKASP